MRKFRLIAACMLALLPCLTAQAKVVESRLSSGIIAAADYRQGKEGLPAVLLLHGALQTRNSPPMSRLADALSDSGYPVLVPTLSLGANRRAKSLACEAVHLHSMSSDVAEIAHWTDWLVARGRRRIVLVGHSLGSLQLLAYLMHDPNPAVGKAILTSLVTPYIDKAEYARVLRENRDKSPPAEKRQPLGRYTLAYCKKSYAASAAAYLSYAEWTEAHILDALEKARVAPIVILGGSDRLFEPGWPDKVKNRGTAVAMIRGSGHFFDGEHEFDLAEQVETILKDGEGGK